MSESSANTPHTLGRRAVFVGAAATAVAAVTIPEAAATTRSTSNARSGASTNWVGSWAGAPNAVPTAAITYVTNQTIRQVLHCSIGGSALRVRLTNEFGDSPLRVGEVRIARRASSTARLARPSTRRPIDESPLLATVLP